jgi:hypothetical protein
MPAFARVIPWLVLGFALAAAALGLYEWSHPPFTDEQLKASIANTWEVATSTTRVFLVVFFGLGGVCVALARKATTATAQLAGYAAAVACLLTLMIFVHNHVELTQRAAGLTGQEFGPLSGLL